MTNSVTATIPPLGTHPRNLAVTPDGRRLYVANFSGSIVYVIDTASNLVINTISVGQGFASPYDITAGLLPSQGIDDSIVAEADNRSGPIYSNRNAKWQNPQLCW
jgi:YVTN family beta-propeller protein